MTEPALAAPPVDLEAALRSARKAELRRLQREHSFAVRKLESFDAQMRGKPQPPWVARQRERFQGSIATYRDRVFELEDLLSQVSRSTD